jgi:hypothetical protein
MPCPGWYSWFPINILSPVDVRFPVDMPSPVGRWSPVGMGSPVNRRVGTRYIASLQALRGGPNRVGSVPG